MKTAIMIPVKLNNERLPGKNTKPLSDGTPLITLILDTVSKVKIDCEKYVYCSDASIREYIPEGIQFLQREKWLDGDDANFQQLVETFLEKVSADVCLLTYATSPFVKAETLECCLSEVLSGKYDSAFTAKKLYEFLWMNGKPLNFDQDNRRRSQDLTPIYLESNGCYVVTRDSFMRNKRRVGDNPYIHEVDGVESLDVDDGDDFEIVNAVYMNMIKMRG